MISYKIREAQLEKVPYMVILGKKEKEKGTLTIRKRDGENIKDVSIQEFIKMVKEKITLKS